MDTNEQRQESQQNRREERHKRRQRSQIIAYTVVGIMILVLAAGIAFAVSKITGMNHDRQVQQNKLDDIIASEETITAPTEPVETVPELTNEQKLDKIIDEAIIQNMPLEDKVAGLFITTPESITGVSAAVQAGDGTKDALSKYPVGGIVYAAKNIQSADQLKQMIDNTKLYTSYPVFIAIDGEGSGTDAVAAAGLGTKTDSPETIGASGDTNNAYTAGTTVGSYLAELGCPCGRSESSGWKCGRQQLLRHGCGNGSIFCDRHADRIAGTESNSCYRTFSRYRQYDPEHEEWHGFYGQKCGRFQSQ